MCHYKTGKNLVTLASHLAGLTDKLAMLRCSKGDNSGCDICDYKVFRSKLELEKNSCCCTNCLEENNHVWVHESGRPLIVIKMQLRLKWTRLRHHPASGPRAWLPPGGVLL